MTGVVGLSVQNSDWNCRYISTGNRSFLSIGRPLIHEYRTNSILCATPASTLPLLSTWLNWNFTNQLASYALLLMLLFSVPPLCARTRLVRDLVLMLHCLSGTVSLAKLGRQTQSHPLSHRAEVCFDCALLLCFVMGYVLQFGEVADKRVHYYYISTEQRLELVVYQ